MSEVPGHTFESIDQTVEIMLSGLQPQTTYLPDQWQNYTLKDNDPVENSLRRWSGCRRRTEVFDNLPNDPEVVSELLQKLTVAFDRGPEQRVNQHWRLMGIVVDTALHNSVEVVLKKT